MVKKNYHIIWDDVAKLELKEAYLNVKKNSASNAENLRKKIVLAVANLKFNPLIYELDRFRISNDGTYRAFEKDSHRVMYRIQADKVFILGVRNANRNPLSHYEKG